MEREMLLDISKMSEMELRQFVCEMWAQLDIIAFMADQGEKPHYEVLKEIAKMAREGQKPPPPIPAAAE